MVPKGLAIGHSRDRVRGREKGVPTFNMLVLRLVIMLEPLIQHAVLIRAALCLVS